MGNTRSSTLLRFCGHPVELRLQLDCDVPQAGGARPGPAAPGLDHEPRPGAPRHLGHGRHRLEQPPGRSVPLPRSDARTALIPGIFPPVMIQVEADGERYDEIHVDGGTVSQVFVYPAALDIDQLSEDLRVDRERRMFVVRNARVAPTA